MDRHRVLDTILRDRQDWIVTGPPGSGKSTILLEVLRKEQGILLEPLRILVHEKARQGGDAMWVTGEGAAGAGPGVVTTPESFLSRLLDARFDIALVDEMDQLTDPWRAGALAGALGVFAGRGTRIVGAGVDVPGRLVRSKVFGHLRLDGPDPEVEFLPAQGKRNGVVEVVKSFLEERIDASVVVFCATRGRAVDVASHLGANGIDAVALHAGMGVEEREAIVRGIADGTMKVVAATSVLAVGVDLPVTHVVVYDAYVPGATLTKAEIVQLAGRARPHRGGRAVVFGIPRKGRRPRLSSMILGFFHDEARRWNELEPLHSVLGDGLMPALRLLERAGLVRAHGGTWQSTSTGRAALAMGLDAEVAARWLLFWKSASCVEVNDADLALVAHLLLPSYSGERLDLSGSRLLAMTHGSVTPIARQLGLHGTPHMAASVPRHPWLGRLVKLMGREGNQ